MKGFSFGAADLVLQTSTVQVRCLRTPEKPDAGKPDANDAWTQMVFEVEV